MKKLLFFLIAVSLLAFVLPVDAQLMDSAWPKFHHDLNNTGQSPYASNTDGTVKWTYSTTATRIHTTPTIDSNNVIYFGDYYNKVYAMYPDGTLKWTFTANEGFYKSSPTFDSNGIIYIGTAWAGKTLYAIYPNGTQKWTFLTGGAIESSPSIDSNGIIYFGSDDYNLYALYPDGTEKWNYTTGNTIRTSPAIASDGTIYFGGTDYKLYALYPDGTEKWNYTTGSWIDLSSPAIGSDGTVYIGSDDNKLYAINPDGTVKWTYTTGGYLNSISIASDNTIYFADWDYYFYAINPDGTLKWKFDTGTGIAGYQASSTIDSNGIIYFGTGGASNNIFYALYPNGTLKWSYTATGVIGDGASPSIGSDGTVYVGVGAVSEKKLYAFESKIPDIFCPIGWCYLAGIANKTLLQLDAAVSNDTIQGRYNSTSKQYQNHRTGYSFNENVIVSPKEGYYYYFTAPKTITPVPGSTPSIILKQGWNLVGNYGSSARTLAELKLSIGATATKTSYYDKTLKKWIDADNRAVPAMESFMAYVITNTVWAN